MIPLRPSRVRRVLQAGGLATTLKINLSDPRVVEIAGLAGVDAVWLCREHVPNDWQNLEHLIRAARIHDVDALVRVERGAYSDYVRPLEAGAAGIIVPHVADADQARQVVDWTRFMPLGRRAMDGGNVDGQFGLATTADYVAHANREPLIILQIESPEALAQVEAIVAVPGFDGIMFGPGDFSHRLGRPGQVTDPAVVAARRRVAAACRAAGKFAMTAGLFAPVAELHAEGHTVFNVGADVLGLGAYMKDRLAGMLTEARSVIPATASATGSPYA
jgi:4-hydroxy-2-oxoheptanedioate aldolase